MTPVASMTEPIDFETLRSRFEDYSRARMADFRAVLGTTGSGAALAEPLLDYLAEGGKRLRPLLTLGSSIAFGGGREAVDQALPAAFALECFHGFILIHDDVIDRSDQRRGRPTLHRRLESRLGLAPRNANNLAIVLGDLVFALALNEIGSGETAAIRRYLFEIVIQTGVGESAEIVNLDRALDELDRAGVEEVYELKTTRYTIEAPLLLGALAAGRTREEMEGPIRAFARPVGLAFQIENDLHEIRLPEEDFVRLGYDFLTGVKTLFLVELWQSLPAGQRAVLREALGGTGAESATAARTFHRLARESGVLPRMQARIDRLFEQGDEALARFPAEWAPGLGEIARIIHSLRKHSESPQPAETRP